MSRHDPAAAHRLAEQGWSSTGSDEDGFRFNGLTPGIYVVLADGGDGRIGLRSGLTIDGDTHLEGIRVEIAPGAELRLLYDGTEESVAVQLYRDGVPIGMGGFERGKAQPVTVPPGLIELRWSEWRTPDVEHVESFMIGVGEQRDLTLQSR